MKKLLSMAFCAAAAATFAEDVTVATVGVTAITLPAGQQNTIIAASFTELATGKNISIANIVKATNLAEGDKILLYTDKNTYSAWKLNANKEWEKADKTYTVGSDGQATESTGDAPETTTATIGTGLWIIRQDAEKPAKIALYGQYVSDKSTTTTAGAWNLVGNAGQAAFSSFEGAVGDQIVTVVNGALRTYNYKEGSGKGWYYVTKENNKGKNNYGAPSIAPGEGFWYYTKESAKTFTWTDVNN